MPDDHPRPRPTWEEGRVPITLDRSSRTPLYVQLYECLSKAIHRGDIEAGTKLPTEFELIKQLGVSRVVVRQAYDALVRDGLVIRERGRGTFVRASNYGVFMGKLFSYQEELALSGEEPSTRVLQFRRELTPAQLTIDPLVVGTDFVNAQDPSCWHIERVRSINETSNVYQDTYLPACCLPGLDAYDFGEDSLYHTLMTEYGMTPTRSHRHLYSELADERMARLLGVKPGSALLVLLNHTYDQEDRLIEVTTECYAGNSVSFEFDVSSSPAKLPRIA